MEEAKQETAWIRPEVDPESNYEKDLRLEWVSAARRLALYICKRLSSDEESDSMELLDQGIHPIAVGFSLMANSGAVEYTRAEAAILYDVLLKGLAALQKEQKETEDTFSIIWHVDYGPNRYFAVLLLEAKELIRKNREATNGPKLPRDWGVGIKCTYRVSKGCATFQGKVIDNKGCLLKENPWETFFNSGKPEDKDIANQLQPKIPEEWKFRFFNRSIVVKAGFTFEKDAVMLANTQNWGVLGELIRSSKGEIPEKAGVKALQITCYSSENGMQWSTIKELNQAGIPLITDKDYYNYYEPLFKVFEAPDSELIYQLAELDPPKCKSFQNFSKLTRTFIRVIVNRYILPYKQSNDDSNMFGEILRFWRSMNLQEDESIQDKSSEWRTQTKLDFFYRINNSENLNSREIHPKFSEWVKENIEDIENSMGCSDR